MNRLQLAEQFRKAVQMFANSLDEDSAMIIATVFDPWKPNTAYKINEFITYGLNGVGDPQLYQVLQAHTSQEDWTPDVSASLWSKVGDPTEEFPAWSQPIGSHDAYAKEDKCSHKGKNWISTIDGNVWEPGVYGWEVVE